MIKDIVVNLTLGVAADPACRYAISLAEAYNAHITGVAFAYDPPWPPSIMEGAVIDVYRTAKDDQQKKAKEAVDRFAQATKQSQLSAKPLVIEASLLAATDAFAALGRTSDLVVVGQPEPDGNATAQDMVETALFASGRPTLIVPYIQKSGFSVDDVLCCWDGSRTAARAIGDSLPLLKKAKRVKVLTVVTGKFDENDVSGADLATHLARHAINTEVVRIPAADIDVANAILSHAADTDASMIVMGGFGHSRLREFVLGGATRGLLESMTVPTLMSH
jgi:nucleotide-binding universal stress UspA family protein